MGLENGVLSFATSLLSRDLRRRVDDDFRFALVQLNPCQTQPRFCPRIAVGSRVERPRALMATTQPVFVISPPGVIEMYFW